MREKREGRARRQGLTAQSSVLLARPSRFPRAPNPLSLLPFQTPATQAIVDCVISVIIGSLAHVPFHKIASGLWGGALRDNTICGRSWVSWTI